MKRMLYICSFTCLFFLSGCSLFRTTDHTPEEELQEVHEEKIEHMEKDELKHVENEQRESGPMQHDASSDK